MNLQELAQRPSTHLLSTRVDGRYLAALAAYWASKGAPIRSVSELARLSLEAFASLLVEGHKVALPTHSEALAILDTLNLKTGTNRKSLIEALHKEDLNLQGLSLPTSAPSPSPSSSVDVSNVVKEFERRLQETSGLSPEDMARNEEFKKEFSNLKK